MTDKTLKRIREEIILAASDMQDLLEQGNKPHEWSERVDQALSQIVEAVSSEEVHRQPEIYPMGTTGNFTDRMGNIYEKR
jgi:hypothetical protein